tara:strand:- start:1916 stop:2086 length:171 start_codon:yes stop_codon:yes gene_type:complete
MKENEIEFINKITAQLAELYIDAYRSDGISIEEVEEIHKEKYDEIKKLYINLIKNN